MQGRMPNSTAYPFAGSFKRRNLRRAKPPLRGAQGHAVQHTQQHGVPVRVLLQAAQRAPRKAAPTRGAGACSAACPSARRTRTRALFSGAAAHRAKPPLRDPMRKQGSHRQRASEREEARLILTTAQSTGLVTPEGGMGPRERALPHQLSNSTQCSRAGGQERAGERRRNNSSGPGRRRFPQQMGAANQRRWQPLSPLRHECTVGEQAWASG